MSAYFVECTDCEYKERFDSLFLASQDANNHVDGYGHRHVRVYDEITEAESRTCTSCGTSGVPVMDGKCYCTKCGYTWKARDKNVLWRVHK